MIRTPTHQILSALLSAGALLGLHTPALAQPDAAHHPVFDFIANRTLAHVEQRGGLLLIAGAPGFAKYNHFSRPAPTWKLRVTEEGKKVALALAAARLDVPLSAEQAQSQSIWLRLQVQSRSSIKIGAVGDAKRTSTPVTLSPGWQTVEIKLPAGLLHAGENELTLTFAQTGRFAVPAGPPVKAAAAVEWIQVGGSAPPPDGAPPALSPGDKGEVLGIPTSGAVYYYVQVPPGGALSVRGAAAGCTLFCSLAGRKQLQDPAEVKLDGTPLSLSSHAGQVLRLGLHARGTCSQLELSSAQLLTAGPAPVVQHAQRPRNVVFWLSDDTRADKFQLWNPRSRVETPFLNAFSQQATRFAVAYVQGNESRVSHASLFTGLYPAQHKFIKDKAVLDGNFVILPEAVKPAGLYTIGHIANGYISKRWGFGDGWDFMRNHIHEGGGLRAGDLVQNAADFLQKGQGKDRPFFLYLGTIDAHVSWRSYEPWISRYDPKPYSGPFVKGCMDPQLDKIVAGELPVSPRDKERIVALYDSDVSYNDKQFGVLLDLLKKSGHFEDTMIVFTSDHGEEFWDHGHIGHGQSLRQELVHVPLWIYYPPLFPPGKVVEEGVEVLDILPTITDALQVKTPAAVQGESLLPLSQGQGAGYPRPAISSQYELAHTMRLSHYKLWVGGSGLVKLFDAQKDPGEQNELSESDPVGHRFVADAMGLWMAYQDKWKKSRWGVASNQLPALPLELEK